MGEHERIVIVVGTAWSTFRFVRNPTAADLLTDPRVRSLFDALGEARLRVDVHGTDRELARVDEALAPFAEVARG